MPASIVASGLAAGTSIGIMLLRTSHDTRRWCAALRIGTIDPTRLVELVPLHGKVDSLRLHAFPHADPVPGTHSTRRRNIWKDFPNPQTFSIRSFTRHRHTTQITRHRSSDTVTAQIPRGDEVRVLDATVHTRTIFLPLRLKGCMAFGSFPKPYALHGNSLG